MAWRTRRRQPDKQTPCFKYLDDPPGLTSGAHKNPVVNEIAEHILQYPDLLEDLARFLLRTVTVQPPGTPAISPIYKKTKGRRLSAEELRLGQLLDRMYETQHKQALDHLRGVVLERIVVLCLKSRAALSDSVLDNINSLVPQGSQPVPSTRYSVDVAGCFPSCKRVEFYVCKLRSERFMETKGQSQLQDFDKLGDAFYDTIGGQRTVYDAVETYICCLESDDAVDEELFVLLDEHFPNIYLYTTDNLMEIANRANVAG